MATTALPTPETLTVYYLVKQHANMLYFSSATATSSGTSMGSGFFSTRHDAEMHRTVEMLKATDGSVFHLFELVIPNPAYKL